MAKERFNYYIEHGTHGACAPCSKLYFLHLLLAAAGTAALHIIVADTSFYFLDGIFQGAKNDKIH